MGATFSSDDLNQMAGLGITPDLVEKQITNYINGFPPIRLHAAASIRHGIHQISPRRCDELAGIYENYAGSHRVIKFVPASGAASRMFKKLLDFRSKYRGTSEDQLLLLKDKGPDSVYYFFEHIREFVFHDLLIEAMEQRGLDFETVMAESRYEKVLNSLLTEKGLNFGNLPKALIPFHSYGSEYRTAFAEHLAEAASYSVSNGTECHIHFTVLPQHMSLMEEHFLEIRNQLEKRYGVRYFVTYSIQEPSTDILAADADNAPFRDASGRLVFRPGGHGALLDNLGKLDADLIIIKNIDNVCNDRHKADTVRYKKVLAGCLINLQEQVFSYLNGLHNPTQPSMKVIEAIWSFVENRLQVEPPAGSQDWKKEEKIEYLKKKLNRPIRICGMVENEGEPGGGPFWIRNRDGSASLQIVEASQIDRKNQEQEAILQNSTHFNPVDIVCSITDFQGNRFNLNEFVDPNTGFITEKSVDGKVVKAQELPGLWNGSMADWNTVFVEVPLTTFNPVKTVNDLLRPEHSEFA